MKKNAKETKQIERLTMLLRNALSSNVTRV